jgi:hypothetical protein
VLRLQKLVFGTQAASAGVKASKKKRSNSPSLIPTAAFQRPRCYAQGIARSSRAKSSSSTAGANSGRTATPSRSAASVAPLFASAAQVVASVHSLPSQVTAAAAAPATSATAPATAAGASTGGARAGTGAPVSATVRRSGSEGSSARSTAAAAAVVSSDKDRAGRRQLSRRSSLASESSADEPQRDGSRPAIERLRGLSGGNTAAAAAAAAACDVRTKPPLAARDTRSSILASVVSDLHRRLLDSCHPVSDCDSNSDSEGSDCDDAQSIPSVSTIHQLRDDCSVQDAADQAKVARNLQRAVNSAAATVVATAKRESDSDGCVPIVICLLARIRPVLRMMLMTCRACICACACVNVRESVDDARELFDASDRMLQQAVAQSSAGHKTFAWGSSAVRIDV